MKYKRCDEVVRPSTRDGQYNFLLLDYLGNGRWDAWEYPLRTTTPVKIHESEFISYKEWSNKRLIEISVERQKKENEK